MKIAVDVDEEDDEEDSDVADAVAEVAVVTAGCSCGGGEVSSARRVELVDNDDDEEGPVLLDGGRLATDCADKFRDS